MRRSSGRGTHVSLRVERLHERLPHSHVLHALQHAAHVQHGDVAHADANLHAELHALRQLRAVQLVLDAQRTLRGAPRARLHGVVLGPQHCERDARWLPCMRRAHAPGAAPIMASPANLNTSPPSLAMVRTIMLKYELSWTSEGTGRG